MGVVCEQVRDAVRRIHENVQNIEDFDAGDLWDTQLDDLQAAAIKLLTVIAAKQAASYAVENRRIHGNSEHDSSAG